MDAVPCAGEAVGDKVLPADAVSCAEVDGKEVALVDGVTLGVGAAVRVWVAAAEPVRLAVDDPLLVAGAERVLDAVAVRDKKDTEEVAVMVRAAVEVTEDFAEAVEEAEVVAVRVLAEAEAVVVVEAVIFAEAVVVVVVVEVAVSVEVEMTVAVSDKSCKRRSNRVKAVASCAHQATCTKRSNNAIQNRGMQPEAPTPVLVRANCLRLIFSDAKSAGAGTY